MLGNCKRSCSYLGRVSSSLWQIENGAYSKWGMLRIQPIKQCEHGMGTVISHGWSGTLSTHWGGVVIMSPGDRNNASFSLYPQHMAWRLTHSRCSAGTVKLNKLDKWNLIEDPEVKINFLPRLTSGEPAHSAPIEIGSSAESQRFGILILTTLLPFSPTWASSMPEQVWYLSLSK